MLLGEGLVWKMAQSRVRVKDTGSTPGHTSGSEGLKGKYVLEARQESRESVKDCDRIRAGVFRGNITLFNFSEHYITSLLSLQQLLTNSSTYLTYINTQMGSSQTPVGCSPGAILSCRQPWVGGEPFVLTPGAKRTAGYVVSLSSLLLDAASSPGSLFTALRTP